MNRAEFLKTSAAFLAAKALGSSFLADSVAAEERSLVAPTVATMPVGLVVHSLDASTLGLVRGLNVSRIRYTVYWHHWGDRQYRRELAEGLERARDLDVLLLVHGNGESLRDFTRFAREVALLSPGTPIQAWNEVDARFPGSHHFNANPARYAAHLRDLRDALPASTRLVSAGLATVGDDVRRWVDAIDRAPCDVVALHTYGFPIILSFQEKAEVARRHTDKPLWNTEFGLEKAVVPEDIRSDWETHQAGNLQVCIQTPGIYERGYIYVLRDERAEGHSLIRRDGSETPAARWLRNRG